VDNITSDLAKWSALVAMIVPFVAAFLNRSEWSPTAKFIVFAIVCAIAAGVTTYLQGGLELGRDRFVSSLLVVATLASAYYRLWKKPVQAVEEGANLFPAPSPTP
jgi:hypothetical protein